METKIVLKLKVIEAVILTLYQKRSVIGTNRHAFKHNNQFEVKVIF